MRALRWLILVIVLATAGLAARAYWWRPGLEAYAAHAYVSPPTQPSAPALRATWFGVTALLLSDGAHAVMVDPFFTRPTGLLNLILDREIAPDEALIAQWLRRAGIDKLDAVLVSHSHYDHAMDAGVVARLTGATLIGSASTANIGRGSGLPESQIRVMTAGVAQSTGPFTLTFIESRHAGATGGRPTGAIEQPLTAPAHYLDYKLGGAYSLLIEHPLGSVLHHGSAGFVPGAIGAAVQGRRVPVVFLGIALREDLPAYLREVVDAAGAQRVIPTHWDDFTRPLDLPLLPMPFGVDLDRFFEDLRQRPDLHVQTLRMGEPVVLFSAESDGTQ